MADEQGLQATVAVHEQRIKGLEDGAKAWWRSVSELGLTRQSLDELTKAVRDLISGEQIRATMCSEHTTELTLMKKLGTELQASSHDHETRINALERNVDRLAWKVGLIIAIAAFALNKLWPLAEHLITGGIK